MLPEGWAEAKLEEVTPTDAPIIYGILQPGPDVRDGVPYIRPTEISAGQIDIEGVRRTSRKIADRYIRSTLRTGDLILSIVGTIGKVAEAPASLDGGNITQSSCRIRPRSGLIEGAFLKAFLRSPTAVQQYDGKRLGTAVPRLNIADIRQFHCPLPPLAEQRRIVATLDSLTARLSLARAELDRVPILADRLRDAALTSVQKDTQHCPQSSVSELSLVMFDGPFGSNLKSADYTDHGARVVRLENIGHLRFNGDKRTFISLAKYEDLARHTLVPGDILFSSFVDREVRVCRFPDDISEPTINKADCFAMRPDQEKCDGKFLTYMLASPATYEIMKEAVHGATRPRISLSHLKDYRLHLPSPETQRDYAHHLDLVFARANRLEAEAARARALLDRLEAAILAKAFRGELVPQDPNDEPAGVLLEWIRAERREQPRNALLRRKANLTETEQEKRPMAAKPLPPRDQLLKDSKNWPAEGLPYEEVAKRVPLSHDEMRDTLFELLSAPEPLLRQRFEKARERMMLQRTAA